MKFLDFFIHFFCKMKLDIVAFISIHSRKTILSPKKAISNWLGKILHPQALAKGQFLYFLLLPPFFAFSLFFFRFLLDPYVWWPEGRPSRMFDLPMVFLSFGLQPTCSYRIFNIDVHTIVLGQLGKDTIGICHFIVKTDKYASDSMYRLRSQKCTCCCNDIL